MGKSTKNTSHDVSSAESEAKQPVVLIVDDDEDIADTYALWLRDRFEVRTAYSGHEAMESLTSDVDVVLLDRRMPNVPGDEVLSRIREQEINCQVAMLTAVEPDSDLTHLDFDEYLVKPVAKSNVVDAVEELLLRDTMDEETQEYLALKSTAEAIDSRSDDGIRDPEAVETLREQVESAGESSKVRSQAAELQRLKNINELMRSVNQTVVEVDSREELDREICRRFVDVDHYEYVLVGEYTGTYDEFVPSATSDGSSLETVSCDDDDSIRRALTENEVLVVDDDEWTDRSLGTLVDPIPNSEQFHSAVVVPMAYRDMIRGATILLTTREIEIGPRERTTLLDVGRTIANAIDSLQTRELVHADTVVELELQVTDRNDVFVDLSAEQDCRVRLEGINFSSDEGIVCYLTVAGRPTERVMEFLVESDGIDTCRIIDDRGDDTLVECTARGSAIALKLLEAGGSVKTFFADGGEGHVTVEMTTDANLRDLLETVKKDFDEVDLVSKRNTERSYESTEGYRSSLEEKLTERQDVVVDTAYNAGYFEWPRESTAEEVADGLGMAPPTFHEHLREAQRKLVEMYLEETE